MGLEMKLIRVVAPILLAALLAPMRAHAEAPPRGPAPSEAHLARARELFDEAAASLQVGRFADAVKELRASLDLVPRTATAFNLAVALRGTGDALAAVALFDKLAAGDYGELDPARREQVAKLRAEVAAEIATLTVVATGADAIEIRVDGEIVASAKPGAAAVSRVNPGAHRIVASARDHETVDRAVDVVRGSSPTVEVTLRLARDERPGHVILECADATATITVEGKGSALGRLERDLPPGEYAVVVHSSNGERKVRLAVPSGRTIKLVLDPPTRSLLQRPLVWVAAGVLVAGGVTVAIVATRPHQADSIKDPYWGVTSTAFHF
jgi:hypothetical protein